MHLEPASVVSLVDELEKLKLVTRSTIASNRRQYQIRLTPKGKEKARQIEDQANVLDSFIKKQLTTSEISAFMENLDMLASSLSDWKNSNKTTVRGGEKIELPSA